MRRRRPQRFVLALVLMAGCWVEYALPAETDGGSSSSSAEQCASAEDGVRLCGVVCVNTEHDPDHCGDCGIECGADQTCEEGRCEDVPVCDCDPHLEVCEAGECICRPGLDRCGDTCVQLRTDREHCGECGRDCGDAFCIEDSCEDECQGPLPHECAGECTDTEVDPLNCGDCGERCESDELCIFGSCRYFDLLEDGCDSCPCEDDCDIEGEGLMCCWSPLLEAPVCLDTPICAD